ncbi:MAG: hypothetical protein IKJ06_03330 [Clostridia bacterium]|nr:hypothetical protein [Clostridia bacterium]
MYKLDRTRRGKIVFGVLALVFFALFFIGYRGGGYEIIMYGFMNEPLSSIVMVSSLFCAVICMVCFFVVNALEKDIVEWLKILDKNNLRK